MPILHPFPPLYDENARVLILGSFPSVKSRETGFFYGHKQNRFWRVMAEILSFPYVPETVEDKTKMLHGGGIALWDTIASCDITGSSDVSITNVTPNDLTVILENAGIGKICCNGTKSYELFMKYTAPKVRAWEKENSRSRAAAGDGGKVSDTGLELSPAGSGLTAASRKDSAQAQIPFVRLPSTSPANAAWSKERLAAKWKRLIFG